MRDRRFDTPDLLPILGGLVAALIVALMVTGVIDGDDTKTNQPPYYQERHGE